MDISCVFRTDITFAVDCVLKINYLSIYLVSCACNWLARLVNSTDFLSKTCLIICTISMYMSCCCFTCNFIKCVCSWKTNFHVISQKIKILYSVLPKLDTDNLHKYDPLWQKGYKVAGKDNENWRKHHTGFILSIYGFWFFFFHMSIRHNLYSYCS